MPSKPLMHSSNKQSGISMVELMISIVLGLMLSAAVLYAYSHASTASKVTIAQSRMNEDAQNAIDILTTQISLTGYNPVQPHYTNTTLRNPLNNEMTFRACQTSFTDIAKPQAPTTILGLTCPVTTSASPHSIAIGYEATLANTIPTKTGTPTDCVGNGLAARTVSVNQYVSGPPASVAPGNVTLYEADNRFYIATDSKTNLPSLYCNSTAPNATAQPLVENVEDMQFLFGVAAPTAAPGTIAGYLTADQIESAAGPMAAEPLLQNRWARVSSVQICVLIRSADPIMDGNIKNNYLACDGSNQVAADRYLRRAYFATVALRSRL